MAKYTVKNIKFLDTAKAERVWVEGLDWNKNTSKAEDGFGILSDNLIYSEKICTRVFAEDKVTPKGLALKEFGKI